MLLLYEERFRHLHQQATLAVAQADSPTLQRHLHTLKSTSAQVGALAISACAAKWEACWPKKGDAPTDVLTELDELFHQARQCWAETPGPHQRATAEDAP